MEMQGQTGSHFEPRVVPPPLPNKCDWEVDPSELDFSSAARIGKVLPRVLFISFALCLLHLRGGYRDIYFKTCSLFVSQLFVKMLISVDMDYSVRFIILCIGT
jgi:hypothetical protein